MRIVIVASDFLPTVGGVQIAVNNIARYSRDLGNDVTILSALPKEGATNFEMMDGIAVHRFPWGRRPVWSLPFRSAITLVRMAKVIREFNPDLVYIHFCSINALWVLLLHYIMRFKMVSSARGNDIQGIPLRSGVQRWMLRRLFARAHAVLFCSSFVKRDAEPYLSNGRPSRQVKVIGDGVDIEEFRDRVPYFNDRPYLLGIGRLVEKKGFDLLIRAFSSLAADFPGMDLLIAGDGDERMAIEKLINELRLRERVHLLGFADRPKTISLLLGCEIFVLSSRLEPFGIVVLEALAAGKAVVATKSGGVVNLIQENVNGKLVEPTVDGLSEGIRSMLSNHEEMLAMGDRAFSTIGEHTWKAVTKQYLNLFESLLRGNGTSDLGEAG
jgi:glycogen synthase